MKTFTVLFFVASFCLNGFSQEYMEKIATKVCACAEEFPDDLEKDVYTMKLGGCLFSASEPYRKQLKKDFGIDLTDNLDDAEKLGEVIGIKMASVCPETLLEMTKAIMGEEYIEEEFFGEEAVEESEYISGIVNIIEDDNFVIFYVKDESGKTEKIYWLDYVEAEFDLMLDYKTLLGQNAYFFYETREIFDPRIGEYRLYKVLTYMELDEE